MVNGVYGKILSRLRDQGVLRTLLYYFFMQVLARAGLHINWLYFCPLFNSGGCTDDDRIELLFRREDLRESCQNYFHVNCGEEYVDEIFERFKQGKVLALGVVEGKPASVAWLYRAKRVEISDENDWFIKSCFTFPHARGLGLFTKSIKLLAQQAKQQTPSKYHSTSKVLIECSIANIASEKGIIRAGFKKKSLLLTFKGKLLKQRLIAFD